MPDISTITLPSGSVYNIKDSVARDMISGGISFEIVWTAANYASSTAPDSTKRASIPSGVTVYYNNGAASSTGTLAASADTKAKFYLVYSKTQVGSLDIFDEYVTIETGADTYAWEKIGDTQMDLSNLVTDVTLNKQTTQFVTGYASPTTDKVIGSDATFSVTQPTISVTPSQTYLGATASGGSVSASGDSVSAITALGTPSTKSAIGASSTFTITQPTIALATGATAGTGVISVATGASASTSKLVTTTVTGVSGSTTASKATAATSQTTANGAGTSSSTNTDWLKGVSVNNESLVIGAATMNTQTTTQFTFSNVTVPKAASSATTVATGSLDESASGASVATGVSATTTNIKATASGANTAWNSKDTVTAVTGYASPTTDTVLGTESSFSVTQPTIALSANASTATGRVQVATGISSATATGAAVAFNSKDEVTALTGLGTASKSAGLNDSTSITVTKGNS